MSSAANAAAAFGANRQGRFEAAHGGRVLTCNYPGYSSWYGALTTRAIVDSGNSVAESNEGNNTFDMTISVSKP